MDTHLTNRRVNTWRQHQSMGQGHDQHIWVGALTGGERGPAASSEGPQRGAGEELRGGLPKSSVLTSLLATDVSAGRSG